MEILFDTSYNYHNKKWKTTGVDKERLYAALRTMGRDHLKNKNMEWSPDNPTRNYCYVVSEWLYRYNPLKPIPFKLVVPEDDMLHYFNGLKITSEPNRYIILDLTREQFSQVIDYTPAKKFSFMKTAGPQPSKRAQLLEHLYNGGELNNFRYISKEDWTE